jgi:hypothetical protein
MPSDERVTRSMCRVQPISDPRPMPEPPRRIWSDEDWGRIQRGYASRDMDEKWDVFTEGRVVFLHRSWTGDGVFAATFAPVDGGGWRIAGAVVERDAEHSETPMTPTTASCSSWCSPPSCSANRRSDSARSWWS